jgi:hypothetical protein
VAAAVIALKRAAEEGQDLPVNGRAHGGGRVPLHAQPGGAEVRAGAGGRGVDEKPLTHSLAQLTSGRVEGPAIVAGKADMAVDLALAAFIKPEPT